MRRSRGLGLLEYALIIIALILVLVVATLVLLGPQISPGPGRVINAL
jgi:Flp pilus assembly pilin Flp